MQLTMSITILLKGGGIMNKDIRLKAAGCGVKLWQIADKLGITDSAFSRKLRKELPEAEKEKIYGIIEQLKSA